MQTKIDAGAIAKRAYEIYLARGCEDGHAAEDWNRAEQELLTALQSRTVDVVQTIARKSETSSQKEKSTPVKSVKSKTTARNKH